MKYFFKKFAKQKIQTESDEFVWLLYFIYCSLLDVETSGSDIWEHLKRRIKDFNFDKITLARIKSEADFILRNLGSNVNTSFSFPVSKIKKLQVKDFRGFGSGFNGDCKGVCIDMRDSMEFKIQWNFIRALMIP